MIEMCVPGSRPASFDSIVIYMQSMNAFLALANLRRWTFVYPLLLIAVVDVVSFLLELVRFGSGMVKTSSL